MLEIKPLWSTLFAFRARNMAIQKNETHCVPIQRLGGGQQRGGGGLLLRDVCICACAHYLDICPLCPISSFVKYIFAWVHIGESVAVSMCVTDRGREWWWTLNWLSRFFHTRFKNTNIWWKGACACACVWIRERDWVFALNFEKER